MSQKVAIIVGAGGQDGTILTKLLTHRGYSVIAISRQSVQYIGIKNGRKRINILDVEDVARLIQKYTPNELYYLAAYHHSSEENLPNDRELYQRSREVHVDGYLNFLEAISEYSHDSSVCYASSCLIYEGSDTHIQNEQTPPVPRSPYAITKLEGMYLGNWYANKYGMKIVNAILYNHESEFRGPNFLSMKVIRAAIAISRGEQDELILGNLSTQIDQGSAWDYVDIMMTLVGLGISGDYIISSGQQYTVQDIVEIVFGHLGLDWRQYVREDSTIVKRKTGVLFGNNTKLLKVLGGRIGVGFNSMILDILKKI